MKKFCFRIHIFIFQPESDKEPMTFEKHNLFMQLQNTNYAFVSEPSLGTHFIPGHLGLYP